MTKGRVSDERLRELLGRMRERLSRAKSLDPDTRNVLTSVAHDIDSALGKEGSAGGTSAAGKTHAPRLESLAVRFEADHPGLAEVIREVIDALVRGGV